MDAVTESTTTRNKQMKRKEGKKWVVRTKNGKKILGKHDTEAKANAQLAAIESSKKRRSGKRGRR